MAKERSRKALVELLQRPGNAACADCAAPGKGRGGGGRGRRLHLHLHLHLSARYGTVLARSWHGIGTAQQRRGAGLCPLRELRGLRPAEGVPDPPPHRSSGRMQRGCSGAAGGMLCAAAVPAEQPLPRFPQFPPPRAGSSAGRER